jgi:hypothetical protein
MALGPIVDVAIGLIFVYLLLGLIASASQELIAARLQLRGKYLRSAIADLVGNANQNNALFQKVFDHGLLRVNPPGKLPSYLPSRTFALALMDSLGDGSQAPVFTQIERSVASLPPGTDSGKPARPAQANRGRRRRTADGDRHLVRPSDGSISGKYKRWCQNYAALFGLAVAIILNVNSLNIAYVLWRDDVLRAMLRPQLKSIAIGMRLCPHQAAHKLKRLLPRRPRASQTQIAGSKRLAIR